MRRRSASGDWRALVLAVLSAVFPGTASPAPPSVRHIAFVLIDGARADTVDRLLAAGRLPQIERHVVRRGLRVQDCITAFPSTTGPAYAPFVTGLLPGRAGIPGIRWYDRVKDASVVYVGTGFGRINRDLTDRCRTIYELVGGDSTAAFGILDRGCPDGYYPVFAAPINPIHSITMDRVVFRVFLTNAFLTGRHPRFMFVSLHAPDKSAHVNGVEHRDYEASLVAADGLVGKLADALVSRGLYESTYIIVSADHGQSSTPQSQDITAYLRAAGLSVRDAIRHEAGVYNALGDGRGHDVHVEVSGNACVQLYLTGRGVDPSRRRLAAEVRRLATKSGRDLDLEAYLLEAPFVELVITRADTGRYRIASQKGASEVRRQGGGLSYAVIEGTDPLGYADDERVRPLVGGAPATPARWLEATAASEFPDACVQVAQILDCDRAGDVVVVARPGWEPWTEGQRGVHGGLRREHMRVPLLVGGPDVRVGTLPRARTVDVFATMAQMLGLTVPEGIDGEAIDWRGTGPPP